MYSVMGLAQDLRTHYANIKEKSSIGRVEKQEGYVYLVSIMHEKPARTEFASRPAPNQLPRRCKFHLPKHDVDLFNMTRQDKTDSYR